MTDEERRRSARETHQRLKRDERAPSPRMPRSFAPHVGEDREDEWGIRPSRLPPIPLSHLPTRGRSVTMETNALARHAPCGVGGAEEGGLLGGCPLRHGLSETTLALENLGLSLSDQDVGSVTGLLALLHQALRRLPHRLRPPLYFRGQHGAAEEMSANGVGEVLATPRAHVRVASEEVCSEFRVAEADVTRRTPGDDMLPAIEKDQRSLVGCQGMRSVAVRMRQTAVLRLDDVGERNRLRALRAIHLHETPRSP